MSENPDGMSIIIKHIYLPFLSTTTPLTHTYAYTEKGSNAHGKKEDEKENIDENRWDVNG